MQFFAKLALSGLPASSAREFGFSAQEKNSISLSGDEFLTHCELHEKTCAFIVHVPGLRKFSREGKFALNDLGWVIAQNLLAETGFTEDGELAVGLKGIILYDDIRTGSHQKVLNDEDENPGLEHRGMKREDLLRFFPVPEAAIESIPEAKAPVTPKETVKGHSKAPTAEQL